VSLLPVELPRKDIPSIFFLGYSASGEKFDCEGESYDASPEDHEFAKEFIVLAEKLLLDGIIKPHPKDVRVGIEGILDGMQEIEDGKVSGVKLVYTIGDQS
jgi:hypothetical protein